MVQDISKVIGGRTILGPISFSLAAGDVGVVIGPSGCGKSTLLRIIAGLDRRTTGRVEIGGVTVDELSPAKRDIAFVFQNFALYPHMSVWKNIALNLEARRLPAAEIKRRVGETLDLLELSSLADRRPHQLSGGQKQRVALGRAIVRRPKLLMMDEPLSNLDTRLRSVMRAELRSTIKEIGTTTLYVTHDQVEALTMGDMMFALDQGQLQQQGHPREVYNKPRNRFVAELFGSGQMNLVEVIYDVKSQLLKSVGSDLPIPDLDIPHDVRSRGTALLGFRPESVLLSVEESPGLTRPLEGHVSHVEHHGGTALLFLSCSFGRVVVQCPSDTHYNKGTIVPFCIDKRAVTFFDPSSGSADL